MNEYNRHDYAGRPTRSALVGVGLALLLSGPACALVWRVIGGAS